LLGSDEIWVKLAFLSFGGLGKLIHLNCFISPGFQRYHHTLTVNTFIA